MLDVITIGDGMITFNPSTTGPLRFVHSFERKIGGAELNFAIGCARLGLKTGWISCLGNDEFGRYFLNYMRGEGIDTSEVRLVDGYPTSLNFKEIMGDGSGRTFYYRKDSPTLTMLPEELNEDYFKKAKLLHITGVFSAIAPKNVDIIHKALEIAKKYGLLISFDPNIRLKLWSEEQARQTLISFLPYVDIVLTGEEEAQILFGVTTPEEMIDSFKAFGAKYIVIKRGEKGSIGAYQGEKIVAEPYQPRKVVDTVGAGDGFDAGFIYGILNHWDLKKSLSFANAVGAMVVSVKGDNEGLPYYDDVLVFLGEKKSIER
jgi:2-dehydro-3-deoxygluconokinase